MPALPETVIPESLAGGGERVIMGMMLRIFYEYWVKKIIKKS